MATLVYFIPGFDQAPAQAAALAGLSVVVGDRPNGLPIDNGPDGRPGWILPHLYAKRSDSIDFAPARQTWVPAPNNEGVLPEVWETPDYWIGFDRDAPPRPEDLLKLPPYKIYGGEDVRLLDGARWHVPQAARHMTTTQKLRPDSTLEQLGGIRQAAELIGINYLLTMPEIVALRLLDHATAFEVLKTYLSEPTGGKTTLPARRGAVPYKLAAAYN